MTEKRESRPIHAINEIVIRGSADVFVKRGEPSMTVIADRPEDVTTEIRGDVLIISQKPTVMIGHSRMVGSGSIQIGCIQGGVVIDSGSEGDRVEISLPELSKVSIVGAGNVRLTELEQDAITLDISGAGNATLAGAVNHLDVKISGAGDVKAKQLEAQSASLRLPGAGTIKVVVSHVVKARLSGAGDIKIWGNPSERDIRVSGVGAIKFK